MEAGHFRVLGSWSLELKEFDVLYLPKIAIKGQAMIDFLVGFTLESQPLAAVDPPRAKWMWTIDMNGSSKKMANCAVIILTSPKGLEVEYALHFDFMVTNNETAYESLLAGLNIVAMMGASRVYVKSDSQLVVNQVSKSYLVKEERMKQYLAQVEELRKIFKEFTTTHAM